MRIKWILKGLFYSFKKQWKHQE